MLQQAHSGNTSHQTVSEHWSQGLMWMVNLRQPPIKKKSVDANLFAAPGCFGVPRRCLPQSLSTLNLLKQQCLLNYDTAAAQYANMQPQQSCLDGILKSQ